MPLSSSFLLSVSDTHEHNYLHLDESIYWPGKTIHTLFLVSWTHSPHLETIEYNHIAVSLWENNKNSGLVICLVKQAMFRAIVKASEEVGIGSVAPHATSVF